MKRFFAAIAGMALAVMAAAPVPVVKATDTPTPQNINALLKVFPGGNLVLPAGDYPTITVTGKTFTPALNLDASAAKLVGVKLSSVVNFNMTGGVITQADGAPPWYGAIYVGSSTNVTFATPQLDLKTGTMQGVSFRDSKNVGLDGARIDRARVAISMLNVDGARIVNNALIGFSIDGIDVANTRNFDVSYNSCSANILVDAHHPDCIQMWSGKDLPQTANGTFRFNVVHGGMQGVSGFNHPTAGQLGFSNITMENNFVVNGYPQGVAVYDCANCTIRNNRAVTQPGAKYRSSVNAFVTGASKVCGNVAEAGAGKKGTADALCVN